MDMITFKRPGKGISPSYKSVIGKAKTKIKRDQIITFDMLS